MCWKLFLRETRAGLRKKVSGRVGELCNLKERDQGMKGREREEEGTVI